MPHQNTFVGEYEGWDTGLNLFKSLKGLGSSVTTYWNGCRIG